MFWSCKQVDSKVHNKEKVPALHTDTWVYKNSKHEFCVLASKHALWCKNGSSLTKNCHWYWISTQIELFWDLFYKLNTSLYGDFTINNQVFQRMYLAYRSRPSPYVSKFLFKLEYLGFWLFWIFMCHCLVKSSMCIVTIAIFIYIHFSLQFSY